MRSWAGRSGDGEVGHGPHAGWLVLADAAGTVHRLGPVFSEGDRPLDGGVLTAPSINEPTFGRDQIQISGSFDGDGARSVAVALRSGALPVDLAPR